MKASHDFRQVSDGWYRLTLCPEGILLEVKRLRWERGELFGVLVVRAEIAGAKTVDNTISVGTFNLTSVSARSARAKDLNAQVNAPEIDWRHILEELCQRTIAAEERGQPIILLRDVIPRPADSDYLAVLGLPIALNHPTVMYAAGGTGKTTLAAAIAGTFEERAVPTLVLDWETDEIDYRAALVRLFGNEFPEVKYRRCERPLTIEVESIAQQIDECGIRYVICDSAGYAADGRPEDAEVALRYFRSLRALRVGSLTTAHISSGEQGTEKPFGSVFWHNSARATWYLERTKETGQDSYTIAAFNKKNNLGRLHPAVGLFLSTENGRTTITATNVADEEQFASRLPLWQRMTNLLKRKPMTIAELASELEEKKDSIEKALKRRDKTFAQITKTADGIHRWGLLHRADERGVH